MTKPMLFKEIAAMLNVSEHTLRRLVQLSENEEIQKIVSKKGTGTYFYRGYEVQLFMNLFSNI